MKLTKKNFECIWSAMSTPLTADGKVDVESLRRLVEHELRLGVGGLFIAGTAGEGPVLSDLERAVLATRTVEFVAGRIPVAMQITDNSAERMLEKLPALVSCGIDIAVIAPPFFCVGGKQDHLLEMYRRVIKASPVPVGIYNLGKNSKTFVAPETIAELLKEPNVVLVKDSSGQEEFVPVILKAKEARKGELFALSGDEFNGVRYMDAGYDGLLWGGGCFNARYGNDILEMCRRGDLSGAENLQARLREVLYKVFGGKDIKCWLAGQKELMVRLGVFNTPVNLYGYRLTPECSAAIDEVIAAEKDRLLP